MNVDVRVERVHHRNREQFDDVATFDRLLHAAARVARDRGAPFGEPRGRVGREEREEFGRARIVHPMRVDLRQHGRASGGELAGVAVGENPFVGEAFDVRPQRGTFAATYRRDHVVDESRDHHAIAYGQLVVVDFGGFGDAFHHEAAIVVQRLAQEIPKVGSEAKPKKRHVAYSAW